MTAEACRDRVCSVLLAQQIFQGRSTAWLERAALSVVPGMLFLSSRHFTERCFTGTAASGR